MKKHNNWRTIRLTMKEAEIIRVALGYLPFEYREGKGDEYDSAYNKIEPLSELNKKLRGVR